MNILAEGMYLLNAAFIHVDYASSTGPTNGNETIAVIVIATLIAVVSIGWVVTLVHLIRSIRKQRKSDQHP
ncbi:MAG: hypothetical protein ACMUHM_08690 [Thermoplasmatota archaeon]